MYFAAAVFLSINFFAKEHYLGALRFVFNEFYIIDWPQQKRLAYILVYVGFYWVLLLYAFCFLVIEFFKSRGLKRNQLKYLIVGSLIGWVGPHGNFLSIIYRWDIYPYSNFALAVYPLVIGYAIVRYQLLDFNIIVKKGIIYSALLTTITFLYLISVRTSEQFFQNFLGYSSVWGSMSITLVVAVLFNPLKNNIQRVVDRIFVRGTTAEIAKQNALLRLQVEQAERYKTMADLTSGIIKEIANPLKALKESDAELDRRMNEPAFFHTYAAREKQEIEKINSLLEHLTNYSNPAQVAAQETNIHKLLNETIGMMKADLTEKNIKLAKEFKAGDDVELKVDASQLRQAFSNIFTNAIEAMPEGGKLYVGTVEAEGFLRITIQDTGDGIKEEDVTRIYDPFFSRKEGHTGLGLSVTRGIIENHQGKIRVRSEAVWGTEFTVELPLATGTVMSK